MRFVLLFLKKKNVQLGRYKANLDSETEKGSEKDVFGERSRERESDRVRGKKRNTPKDRRGEREGLSTALLLFPDFFSSGRENKHL